MVQLIMPMKIVFYLKTGNCVVVCFGPRDRKLSGCEPAVVFQLFIRVGGGTGFIKCLYLSSIGAISPLRGWSKTGGDATLSRSPFTAG